MRKPLSILGMMVKEAVSRKYVYWVFTEHLSIASSKLGVSPLIVCVCMCAMLGMIIRILY